MTSGLYVLVGVLGITGYELFKNNRSQQAGWIVFSALCLSVIAIGIDLGVHYHG